MSRRFVLDENGEPREEPDLMTWGRWMEKADRHVGDDMIDGVRVSTVFLGIDHSFAEIYGQRPPVLFETLVFGGDHDDKGERYETREAALAGHARFCALVRGQTEMHDGVIVLPEGDG